MPNQNLTPIRLVVLQGRQVTVIHADTVDGRIVDCAQEPEWNGKTPEDVRELLGEYFLTWEHICVEEVR